MCGSEGGKFVEEHIPSTLLFVNVLFFIGMVFIRFESVLYCAVFYCVRMVRNTYVVCRHIVRSFKPHKTAPKNRHNEHSQL